MLTLVRTWTRAWTGSYRTLPRGCIIMEQRLRLAQARNPCGGSIALLRSASPQRHSWLPRASLHAMTIRAVLIFNNYGNPRVSKFYSHLPVDRQQALIQLIFQLVSRRDDKTVCNFLDAPELTPLLPPMTADAWTKASSAPLANAGISDSITSEDDADQNYDPWVTYSKTQPAPTKKTNTRWRPDDELRVIYRHYATLYFVLVVDQSESELGILDLIQVCTVRWELTPR